jgi:hypothetical protein
VPPRRKLRRPTPPGGTLMTVIIPYRRLAGILG